MRRMLGISLLVLLSGCAEKQIPRPVEENGIWRVNGKAVEGEYSWCETSEGITEHMPEGFDHYGYWAKIRIRCVDGVLQERWQETNRPQWLPSLREWHESYRNGLRHGVEEHRQIGGPAYQIWVDGKNLDESAVDALTREESIALGLDPELVARAQKKASRGPTEWTKYSTGHTWIAATEEEKRELAQRLPGVSRYGNSANYFYDALEEFYSEPTVRGQKLDDICTLIDAGGTALPPRMRRY